MVTSAARLGVAVLVGLALAVSCAALAASAFEQWGTSHFDEGALRMSLRLQSGRLWAAELVAVNRALDGRSGDRAAAEEARTLIETAERPFRPPDRPANGRERSIRLTPERG